jgi:hypothetical protein
MRCGCRRTGAGWRGRGVPGADRPAAADRADDRARAEGGGLPMARVSRDAGEHVQWSGDSQRLHWSLGPELYTRELKDAFSFVAGRAGGAAEAGGEGGADRLQGAEAAAPTGTRAIVGARVITMRGDEVIERATIVITGDRITAIGPAAQVPVPAGAEVIKADGKTIIPGINRRARAREPGRGRDHAGAELAALRELAFGVTTVHDPSNDTSSVFAASELQRAGLVVGPRIFSTGTILYGAMAPFKAEIASLEDARSTCAAEGDRGVLGEELQPAASRAAPAGAGGGARARDDGGAGGRRAVPAQHDDGGRRAHGGRARAAGRANATRT